MLLQTNRLTMRRFSISDDFALESLLGCSEVMKSSVSGPLNTTQIKNWLREQITIYNLNQGTGAFAVIENNTSELIGYCGLFHFDDIDGTNEVEIGYRFLKKYWGNGYATEAASAIRNYAFADLNLSRLISLIEPSNIRSVRVAKKLGMKHEKDVMLEGYDHPDHLYSICKSDQHT